MILKLETKFGKTGLGEIPKDWNLLSISSISELVMGQSPKGDSYNNEGKGIPLLNGPTEFGFYHPTPVQFTTSPTRLCKKNDILLCVRGSTTGRLNRSNGMYCIGRGLAAIRGMENKTDTDWLYYHFLTMEKYIYNIASGGGSTFPNINRDVIEKIVLPHPSFGEQRKIASVLSKVDELIHKTDQIIEQTQKLKKGLIQRLLNKGIGHGKYVKTELGEIPEAWSIKKFGDFSDTYRYPTFYGIQYQSEGIPVLNIGNIDNNSWRLSTNHDNYQKISSETSARFDRTIVREGDLVLAVRGATIGKLARVPKELSESNINANLLKISLDKQICNPSYFWFYGQTNRGKGDFRGFVSSTAKETVQAGKLQSWKIPIPSLKEQDKIVEILENQENWILSYTKNLKGLENLKKGLMQKLLTGKIRVKV